MDYKKVGNHYVIRLGKGEDIIEKVIEFCKDNGINSGHFSGIGALDEVEVGYYDEKKRKYHTKTLNEKHIELLSLKGNVSLDEENNIKVHAHVVISDAGLNARGGHLVNGKVSITCEIIFTPFEGTLKRKHHERIGLQLLDF